MYDTGDLLPGEGLPAGSTVLVLGPPMAGKRELVLQLLASGVNSGEGAIIVSTDVADSRLIDEFGSFLEGSDAAYRVGLVESIDSSPGEDIDFTGRVEQVGSPTDLSGIGIGTSRLIDQLQDVEQTDRIRVGLLSLTTMLLYADPERVLKFLHVFTRRMQDAGSVAFVLAQREDIDEQHLHQARSLIDGEIEIRQGSEGSQLRVQGFDAIPSAWVEMPTLEPPTPLPAVEPSAPESSGTLGTEVDPRAESLPGFVRAIETERPTLTIYNRDGDPADVRDVDDYFSRLNVDVRETTLREEQPRNVALLHRGDDLLAASPLSSLQGAIQIDTGEESFPTARDKPDILDRAQQATYRAQASDTGFLIEVSYTIEALAWRTGEGTIHAGFQQLSRFAESPRSRRIYERIADAGVDVHVYGQPDAEVDYDAITIHGEPAQEIRDCWFVVYDGANSPSRTGALVAEERDPDTYYGFWSYQPVIADELAAYLSGTYLDRVRQNL